MMSGAGLGCPSPSTGLAAYNLGGVAGAIAGGWLIGRLGSRMTMLSMAAGASVGGGARRHAGSAGLSRHHRSRCSA